MDRGLLGEGSDKPAPPWGFRARVRAAARTGTPRYDLGIVNLNELGSRLLDLFRHELSTPAVNTFENSIAAGEGWLAVYDLINWAIDTNRDVPAEYLQIALDATERRAYGKLSEPFRATLLGHLSRQSSESPSTRG